MIVYLHFHTVLQWAGSQKPHRSCPLVNKVENVDRAPSSPGMFKYVTPEMPFPASNRLFLMNRFRTGQGSYHANLHRWGLAQSPSYDCGQRQTMNHIVDTCPLTKLEGGLNLLDKADDDWNLQRLQHSRNK